MEEERQKACEEYIQRILDENKYFVFPMLRGGEFGSEELFITLKDMREKKKLATIRVPCKSSIPDDSVVFYTTVEYSYLNEPRQYLKSIGISASAAVSYMTRLRTSATYKHSSIIRTERKKATLRDIDCKNEIIQYLNKNGPADVNQIATAMELNPTRAKALVSSLSVSKSIKYDPRTRTYTSISSRY